MLVKWNCSEACFGPYDLNVIALTDPGSTTSSQGYDAAQLACECLCIPQTILEGRSLLTQM